MSYRGGPTNSESYFSFISANILFICATVLLRRAPIHLFSLGAQLDELLKGSLRAPGDESRKHPSPLGPANLEGVDRPPRALL